MCELLKKNYASSFNTRTYSSPDLLLLCSMQESESSYTRHYLLHKRKNLLQVLPKTRAMIRNCASKEKHGYIVIFTIGNPDVLTKIVDRLTNIGSILKLSCSGITT